MPQDNPLAAFGTPAVPSAVSASTNPLAAFGTEAAPAASSAPAVQSGVLGIGKVPTAADFAALAPKAQPPSAPIPPPQDAREELAHKFLGDSGVSLYRKARTFVGQVEEVMKPEGSYGMAKQALKDAASALVEHISPGDYSLNPATNPVHDQPVPVPLKLSTASQAELAPAIAASRAAGAQGAATAATAPSFLGTNPFSRAADAVRRGFSPTAAAQPEAQAALRAGAEASAADAGVASRVVNAPGAGVRTLMAKPIAEATKIEDGLYSTINNAAETDMKSLYDRQEELQETLDDPTQIHNRAALQNDLNVNQADIAVGESKVQAKLGTDAQKLIQKAKAATQQRFAMEAGDAKLFNNEGVVKGNAAVRGSKEVLNVDAAIRQTELLDKASKFAPRGTPTRLEQMFGVDGAKAFKQGLYNAKQAGDTVLNRNKVLAILGGAATVGGTTWDLLSK